MENSKQEFLDKMAEIYDEMNERNEEWCLYTYDYMGSCDWIYAVAPNSPWKVYKNPGA